MRKLLLAALLALQVGGNSFYCSGVTDCAALAESLGCVLVTDILGNKYAICPVKVTGRHEA